MAGRSLAASSSHNPDPDILPQGVSGSHHLNVDQGQPGGPPQASAFLEGGGPAPPCCRLTPQRPCAGVGGNLGRDRTAGAGRWDPACRDRMAGRRKGGRETWAETTQQARAGGGTGPLAEARQAREVGWGQAETARQARGRRGTPVQRPARQARGRWGAWAETAWQARAGGGQAETTRQAQAGPGQPRRALGPRRVVAGSLRRPSLRHTAWRRGFAPFRCSCQAGINRGTLLQQLPHHRLTAGWAVTPARPEALAWWALGQEVSFVDSPSFLADSRFLSFRS